MLMAAMLVVGVHPEAAHAAGTAIYVQTDTTTKGNWKGIYGGDGFTIVKDASSNNPSDPSYATVLPAGGSAVTISTVTGDASALRLALPASTDRIAAEYRATDSVSVDINTTDGTLHQFALYMVDWLRASRTQSVTITDAVTHAVLDTRSVSAFNSGVYLVWKVGGHVTVTVTKTAGSSATFSGWFFDYPGPLLSKIVVTPANLSVAKGTTQQFTATALDQNGNALSIQPPFTWAVAPGSGSISASGVLTPSSVTGGPYHVAASAGGVSGLTSFRVASTHTVTFGSTTSIPVTGQVNSFINDLDGDGHLDIVSIVSGSLNFLYGKGDGTFTSVAYPYSGLSLGGLCVAGDLKGNGKTDLVLNSGTNVAVIINLGSRTFAAPVYYPSVTQANAIALGDFNEDDRLDIANVSPTNSFVVLLNNGDGTFGAPTSHAVPGNNSAYAVGIVATDVDSDGHIDIVTSSENEFNPSSGAIFFGDGAGNFLLSSAGITTVGGGRLLTTDFNNDGLADIAASDHWSGQPRWGLGDGKGAFPFQFTQGGAGYAGALTAADFDGDGYKDLAEAFDGRYVLYPNNGNGTFPASSYTTVSDTNPISGDMNEDGQPDMMMTTNVNNVIFYPNTTNPAPTITNLVPNGAATGSTTTLTVRGHGLLKRSVIKWNGTPLTTTFDYKTDSLSATLTPTQTAVAGNNTVTVYTSTPGGGTSNSVKFYVGHVPTSILVSPTTGLVNVGSTVAFTAFVLDQNHAAMPTEPTVTWSTKGKGNTITPEGVLSPGDAAGAVNVFASYGDLTGSSRAAVRDFTLTATPSTVTVTRGSHASSVIGFTRLNGFSGSVMLKASGLPGGVVATLHEADITATGTVTFTASATATVGTYSVTITGVSNGAPRTKVISLTVN